MLIRYANIEDTQLLKDVDKHISGEELVNLINLKRVILMYKDNIFIGWLRYNLFWDNIPFVNMLYFMEDNRGKGYGSKLIGFWENEMKKLGYKRIMTSSQADEQGQKFYRKNGYKDVGSIILPNEILEIIFHKDLN